MQSVKAEGGLLKAADEFGAEWKHAAGAPRAREAKGRQIVGSAVPSVHLRLDGDFRSATIASWAVNPSDPGIEMEVRCRGGIALACPALRACPVKVQDGRCHITAFTGAQSTVLMRGRALVRMAQASTLSRSWLLPLAIFAPCQREYAPQPPRIRTYSIVTLAAD